jgi:phage antirepressor YoqD-like protein
MVARQRIIVQRWNGTKPANTKSPCLGLFELKPQTWTNPRTDEMMTTTRTMVTGKGKEYFINKFIYNAERKKSQ